MCQKNNKKETKKASELADGFHNVGFFQKQYLHDCIILAFRITVFKDTTFEQRKRCKPMREYSTVQRSTIISLFHSRLYWDIYIYITSFTKSLYRVVML